MAAFSLSFYANSVKCLYFRSDSSTCPFLPPSLPIPPSTSNALNFVVLSFLVSLHWHRKSTHSCPKARSTGPWPLLPYRCLNYEHHHDSSLEDSRMSKIGPGAESTKKSIIIIIIIIKTEGARKRARKKVKRRKAHKWGGGGGECEKDHSRSTSCAGMLNDTSGLLSDWRISRNRSHCCGCRRRHRRCNQLCLEVRNSDHLGVSCYCCI